MPAALCVPSDTSLMFLKELRSAAKLGKAQGRLARRDYSAALIEAEKAKKIGGITENNDWLYYSVIGKSLYHQNKDAEALVNLNRAEELTAPLLKDPNVDESVLNFILKISWYIEKIEKQTHNKKRNEMDSSVEPPIR